MTYDQPVRITYTFGQHDFGAGDDSMSIKGPAGKEGKLVGMQVRAVGETFNSVTTSAFLRVGTAADPDAFGQLEIGDLADTDTISEADDTDAIIDPTIPADTQVEITLVAPTGGTPAGMGQAQVTIEWW